MTACGRAPRRSFGGERKNIGILKRSCMSQTWSERRFLGAWWQDGQWTWTTHESYRVLKLVCVACGPVSCVCDAACSGRIDCARGPRSVQQRCAWGLGSVCHDQQTSVLGNSGLRKAWSSKKEDIAMMWRDGKSGDRRLVIPHLALVSQHIRSMLSELTTDDLWAMDMYQRGT